jgi:hypothetical protein
VGAVSGVADQEVEPELLVLLELDDEGAVLLAVVVLSAADLTAMPAPRPRNRTALSTAATTRDRRAAWRWRWVRSCTGVPPLLVGCLHASSLHALTGAELRGG